MFIRNRNLGSWWDDIGGVLKEGKKVLTPAMDIYKEYTGGESQTTTGTTPSTTKEDGIMTYLPYIAIGGILLFVLMGKGSSKSIPVTSPKEG